MKKVLSVALLGPLHLKIDQHPLQTLVSAKGVAILCYLISHQRPFPRQTIAALFWGNMPEEDARRNLRGVIMKLRQSLAPYLLIEKQTLAFNFESPFQLDTVRFDELVAAGTIADLETAVSLYRGEFLAEFHIKDAPEFESWLERERRRRHQGMLQLYDRLVGLYEAAGQFAKGVRVAQRLVDLEPTREASHRHLIRLLAAVGQVDTAVDQYETLTALLQNELGVPVSDETTHLLQQIRAAGRPATPRSSASVEGTVQQPSPSAEIALPPPFIAGPPITFPARFFGREAIVKRLFRLFQKRPFQNAAILGPRRSGKTSLLHYLRTITTVTSVQKRPDQKADWFENPLAYRWVFVDFQDARFGEPGRLIHFILSEIGLSAPHNCELDQFMDIMADELKTPTIILFDEIGVALTRYGDRLDDAFWESLRSLATNQLDGRLGFVLSSHLPPSELATSQGFGSPFFNIFGYTAVLRALKEEAAQQLIASSPLPFSTDDGDWILAQSQCWPMPLQILCRERLIALEEGESGVGWRDDALLQCRPFLPQEKG